MIESAKNEQKRLIIVYYVKEPRTIGIQFRVMIMKRKKLSNI